ncbi:MAG: response regulator [Campylobacterota bacterium]|nr:response regulator [Campylobacterota bacterium]
MITNNKTLKLSIISIIIFIGSFIYFEYTMVQKYFIQNLQKEQKLVVTVYNQNLKDINYRYTKRVQNIFTDENFIKAITTNNRELLKGVILKKYKKLQEENNYIKKLTLTDINNITLFRAHKPKEYGDDLTNIRPIIKKVNEIKKSLYGFETGKHGIPYRITVPIVLNNIHYGVFELGISTAYFSSNINTLTNNSVNTTVLLDKKVLKYFVKDMNVENYPIKRGYVAPKFNQFFEPLLEFIDFNNSITQMKIDDKYYLVNSSFKIKSFDKTSFGMILVAYDISDDIYTQHKEIIRVLLIMIFFILTIYTILRFYEKELIKQKKSYEMLFQNSTDGILIIKNNKFIDCNNSVLKMLNCEDKNKILHVHPSSLSPKVQPDGQDSFLKANDMITKALENGSHRFEWVHKRKDGENFWCEVALTSMHINGEDIIHTSWRDITSVKDSEKVAQNIIEQKTKEYKIAMQTAQNANNAKSQFLANMSHEIRTPLNAIMGFIELLKEDEQNEDKKKYLKTIDKSSHNLLEIINDILDFSKIESNLIELEYRDYNPLDEFESIVELFKARVLEKNITFDISIDKNLPNHINSDALRIKQVIINLLSNAIKFTSANKTVSFKVEFKDNTLSVYIKDEGIGIASDKLQTIFKPFTQADNSTTRKFGGTGLGLTISSELIKALGGKLEVKSQLNIGSEFYFAIPVKVIDKEIRRDTETIKDEEKLSGHILLVEDNKANQMFMKVILKKMGFTFEIANNGLEALERFPKLTCQNGKTKYDVILMDENMPNMNGIEATNRILEIEKELDLPHTPIIALTANALKGDRERFLDAGMDEYLTKPVNKKKLVNILTKVLND